MSPEVLAHRMGNRRYYAKNKEKVKAYYAKWRAANMDKWRECIRQYQEAHPERINEAGRRYRERHPEKNRDRHRQYNAMHPGRKQARCVLRRARKLNATPQWVDREAIAAIYAEAASRGKHVDHIVPLAGKNVCGLHVPWNLQLLDPAENLRKSNKLNWNLKVRAA